MTETKKPVQKKKKTRKRLSPFMKLMCFILIGVSCWMLWQVVSEVRTSFQLKKDIVEVEQRLQDIKDENAKLTSERDKLSDPDYVANYARGNYLLSKDDEQIFYLPEKDK